MKTFNLLFVFLMLFGACKGQVAKEEASKTDPIEAEYLTFGDKIEATGSLSGDEMVEKFNALAVADTLNTKFTATVTEVCQSKGCWMKLQLQDGKETMVKFKDYGFFMPKDIAGKEVIVHGKAFVEAMSVDDQRHYAEDGGATETEIAQITEPKKTFSFEADGVLLKQ
ncbi:MAG: DUF4920 domain-containing protein [Flavobacteriaceae bacterium]